MMMKKKKEKNVLSYTYIEEIKHLETGSVLPYKKL